MSDFPKPPLLTACLNTQEKNAQVRKYLARRRSTPLSLLQGPAPNAEQLDFILRIAARVPDHRCVVPWRFIVFQDEAIHRAAKLIGTRYAALHPECSTEQVNLEVKKFATGPLVVALVSSPDIEHKTPVWEQELSAGAAGQNLLLAANASGFAAVWLTCWYAFDAVICRQFGLAAHERIAGFFHLGKAREKAKERPRPQLEQIISRWQG